VVCDIGRSARGQHRRILRRRGPSWRTGHHPVPRRSDDQARRARWRNTSIPAGGIDDALVILGRTTCCSPDGRFRSALDALRDVGRPRVVQLGRPGGPRPPRATAARPTMSARTCRRRAPRALHVRAGRAGRSRRRGHRPRRTAYEQAICWPPATCPRDQARRDPGRRRTASRRPCRFAKSASCRRCGAAPSSRCSTRTPLAPGCPSRSPASG